MKRLFWSLVFVLALGLIAIAVTAQERDACTADSAGCGLYGDTIMCAVPVGDSLQCAVPVDHVSWQREIDGELHDCVAWRDLFWSPLSPLPAPETIELEARIVQATATPKPRDCGVWRLEPDLWMGYELRVNECGEYQVGDKIEEW